MSKKTKREKDEKRLLAMMEQLEKISWNVNLVDEALAMAWKYMNLSERQAMRIQELERKYNELVQR